MSLQSLLVTGNGLFQMIGSVSQRILNQAIGKCALQKTP